MVHAECNISRVTDVKGHEQIRNRPQNENDPGKNGAEAGLFTVPPAQGADRMDRTSVTIKTYQSHEEDATIHIDVEEGLLELAKDIHTFYM